MTQIYKIQLQLQEQSKYINDRVKSNKKETDSNRKCFVCGNSWLHKNGKSSCLAFGCHCKTCGKQNHFESKCKIQISQVNKLESSIDSGDSYIYEINLINKVSSKNILRLRINKCDIDFQIDLGASVNVICKHDFNILKNIDLNTSNTIILHVGKRHHYQLKVVFIQVLYSMI